MGGGGSTFGNRSTVAMVGKSKAWKGNVQAGETAAREAGGCVFRVFRGLIQAPGTGHFSFWPLSACFVLSPS